MLFFYTKKLEHFTTPTKIIEPNKSINENDKSTILKEINQLTETIDIAQAQKNACVRIIGRYTQIKEDYKKEVVSENKAAELIKEDKKKRLRYR